MADLEAGSVPPLDQPVAAGVDRALSRSPKHMPTDSSRPAAGRHGTHARRHRFPGTGAFGAVRTAQAHPQRDPVGLTRSERIIAATTLTDMPRMRIRRPESADAVLPVPPSDTEKYAYIRRHSWVLTVFSALTFIPLIFIQVRMFVISPWYLLYAPFVLLGTISFLLSIISDGLSPDFNLDEHKKVVAGYLPLWNPSVDVFLPICGEPIELLRNTWTYVAALRNSYNGKVTPYVLDDGANPEARALAKEFGFAYVVRPDRGWYKKSGNLKYAFEISDGEFILLLDADFAPRTDFLNETMPYFALYPDVGIVQTPQFFHVNDDQTWIERGAGAGQELFYRLIQTARTDKGSAICVGSCAVYRREALAENGGVSLAEHSEDLHTGFDLQQMGWQLRYLPIALSTGNCPDSTLAFLNQQYRWCSGTFSLLGTDKFWRAPLSLQSRLGYLAGLAYYIYTAIYTFIGPAFAISMLIFSPAFFDFRYFAYIIPVLFYTGVVYPMWHRSPYRLEAWSVRIISGWAHVFALWDIMRGQLRGWQPSGTGSKRQDGRRRLLIGLVGWSLGSSALWALLALWRMTTVNAYNFSLIFMMAVFQLVVVSRVLIQPREGAG